MFFLDQGSKQTKGSIERSKSEMDKLKEMSQLVSFGLFQFRMDLVYLQTWFALPSIKKRHFEEGQIFKEMSTHLTHGLESRYGIFWWAKGPSTHPICPSWSSLEQYRLCSTGDFIRTRRTSLRNRCRTIVPNMWAGQKVSFPKNAWFNILLSRDYELSVPYCFES